VAESEQQQKEQQPHRLVPVVIPIVVALIGAVAVVAVALLGNSGALTVVLPGSPTQTVTALGPTMPGPTTTIAVTATPTGGAPQNPAAPKYVVDLEPQLGNSVQAGFVTMAGKPYKKSLRASLCFGAGQGSIVVEVPQGYTKFKGVVGFVDSSSGKPDTSTSSVLHGMQIEVTTDPAEVGERTWTRLDNLRLFGEGRKVTSFAEDLPPGTVAIRLAPDGYACSTTIAWGDPILT
jgi:hypothetical protein